MAIVRRLSRVWCPEDVNAVRNATVFSLVLLHRVLFGLVSPRQDRRCLCNSIERKVDTQVVDDQT